MFLTVNGYAYCRGSYRYSWRLLWVVPRILYAYIRVVPKLLRNMQTQWREEALPAYLKTIEEWTSVDLVTAADRSIALGRAQPVRGGCHLLVQSVDDRRRRKDH